MSGRLVAETTRTSTSRRTLEPSTSKVRSCSTRSIFTCDGGSRSPISSRKIVPPCGDLEAALAIGAGVGEGAADVAEHLALEQRRRHAAEIDLHERLGGAAAVAMDRLGDQFLAGAALAGDQHRRVGRRDAADQLEDAQQPRVAADQIAEVVARIQLVARQRPLALIGPRCRPGRARSARSAASAGWSTAW